MSPQHERTVGICLSHWKMHCEPDTVWAIPDHLRPPSSRDEGPKCSIRECRENRSYGYVIREVSRCE